MEVMAVVPSGWNKGGKERGRSKVIGDASGQMAVSWLIMFYLTIFHIVLTSGSYRSRLVWWYSGWLVVLFRSGNEMLCGDYIWGISVMDTLAKIQYDTLIRLNRLKLWCDVDKCQAGARERRGCIEQIVSLRLLCDYAVYVQKSEVICDVCGL